MEHRNEALHNPLTTEVLSLWDEKAQDKAAHFALQGFPVGVNNRGVCAIWGDGANPDFPNSVLHIKGEQRGERPLAASMRTKDIVKFIDTNKIPLTLHKIFTESEELASRTSSLCFIRVPITEAAAKQFPHSMVSRLQDGTPVVQNWDPQGHKPTNSLIEKMISLGIKFPAVTSMNVSGTPEIVDEEKGIEFSKKMKIPIFLTDPIDRKRVQGGYTIFGVNPHGIELIRDGNIPSHLFNPIFDNVPIDTSKAKKAVYPQADFPQELLQGLNPSEARIAILTFVSTDWQPEGPILKR